MIQLDEIWNSLINSARLSSKWDSYYANEERAKQYDASVAIWEDAKKRVDELNLDPSSSILEIGPGPGVMTIPLAKRVKSVTVVEPSPAMSSLLRKHISEEKICNVNIINKKWELISSEDLERYEFVLASYCLDMLDISHCLKKMCTHASKAVHLWWFSGITSWEKVRVELAPSVIGKNVSPYPKSDILMQILKIQGYNPDYQELSGTTFSNSYTTYEDACRRMVSILDLDPTSSIPLEVAHYIEKNWKKSDGSYGYEDTTTFVHITIPILAGN